MKKYKAAIITFIISVAIGLPLGLYLVVPVVIDGVDNYAKDLRQKIYLIYRDYGRYAKNRTPYEKLTGRQKALGLKMEKLSRDNFYVHTKIWARQVESPRFIYFYLMENELAHDYYFSPEYIKEFMAQVKKHIKNKNTKLTPREENSFIHSDLMGIKQPGKRDSVLAIALNYEECLDVWSKAAANEIVTGEISLSDWTFNRTIHFDDPILLSKVNKLVANKTITPLTEYETNYVAHACSGKKPTNNYTQIFVHNRDMKEAEDSYLNKVIDIRAKDLALRIQSGNYGTLELFKKMADKMTGSREYHKVLISKTEELLKNENIGPLTPKQEEALYDNDKARLQNVYQFKKFRNVYLEELLTEEACNQFQAKEIAFKVGRAKSATLKHFEEKLGKDSAAIKLAKEKIEQDNTARPKDYEAHALNFCTAD